MDFKNSEIPIPNVENEEPEESDDDIENDDANIDTFEYWKCKLKKWEEILMEKKLAKIEQLE